MPKFFSIRMQKLLILIGALFLQGCHSSHKKAPSIDIFGSYFPAWLISLAAGIVFTVIAGAVGRLIEIRPTGFWAFLMNVGLILIFTISVWFWFFAT